MEKVNGHHEGERLRAEVAATKLNQRQFARQANIPIRTLTTWFEQRKLKIRMDYVFRLAEAFRKLGRDEHFALSMSHPTPSVWDQLAEGAPVGEKGEIERIEWLDGIPISELSLAAGPKADVLDVPEVLDPATLAKGLFGARLAGDSMEPDYHSGLIVIFQVLRDGLDSLERGKDYYLQWADGGATFKRVTGIGKSRIIMRALNSARYPDEMHADRSQIVRVAKARGKFEPIE